MTFTRWRSRRERRLRLAPGGRRLGRLTLDIRQQLSPLKQAAFLGGSLAIGLAISVAILAIAGVAPGTLIEELATVFNVESLRAVLVQAAPLTLVGLAASSRLPDRILESRPGRPDDLRRHRGDRRGDLWDRP